MLLKVKYQDTKKYIRLVSGFTYLDFIAQVKCKFGLPAATELDAFDETNKVVEENIFSELIEDSRDLCLTVRDRIPNADHPADGKMEAAAETKINVQSKDVTMLLKVKYQNTKNDIQLVSGFTYLDFIAQVKCKFGLPAATELDAFDETNTVVEEDIFSELIEASPDLCLTVRDRIPHAGQDLYEEVSRCVDEMGLPWEKLVGLTTDGAPAMCGHRSGLVARMRERMREENVTDQTEERAADTEVVNQGTTVKDIMLSWWDSIEDSFV
ncbi:uncharacterized protein LOC133419025 [Cololabis saira]|uniref:uncharacterized protein LOC133419025 n=1 Tax=Cololabis saira TaxID=129043 RepID=UPI002AD43E8E|nr:uncharacterized protein LOC133419025 [Cololabis saira]